MQIVERTSSDDRQKAVSAAQQQLNVVCTGKRSTRVALEAATELASNLDATVRVIVLRAVPYPLPLEDPPVPTTFDRERMLPFVEKSSRGVTLLICYCRDQAEGLLQLLESDQSIVVMAGKKRRWFPTRAQRLAGRLEEAGHPVVFVHSGENHA